MKLKYLCSIVFGLQGCASVDVVLPDPDRYGRTDYDVCIRCGDEPVWINRDYVGEDGDLTDVYPR